MMLDSVHGRFKAMVKFTDHAVFEQTGKHLSNAEMLVLEGTWRGQKYPQIALDNGYACEYLKNDVGPKLWRRLTEVFGEKISKANVRIVLQSHFKPTAPVPTGSQTESVADLFHLEVNEGFISDMGELDSSILSPLGGEAQSTVRRTSISSSGFSLQHSSKPSSVVHNLPYHEMPLVGREQELRQLCQFFQEHPTHARISIEGPGGIGKTRLMLEFANYCLRCQSLSQGKASGNFSELTFDNIIFVSAQSQYCTSQGLLPRVHWERNLDDILLTILQVLKSSCSLDLKTPILYRQALQALTESRTLMLIDNFETLEEQKAILGFLYALPPTVQVIITSRKQTLLPSLSLKALSPASTAQLIQHQAQQHKLQISQTDRERIGKLSSGVPAAIIYVLSLLALGHSLIELSSQFQGTSNQFSQFYLEREIQSVLDESAQKVLRVLAFCVKGAQKNSLLLMSGVESNAILENALRLLQCQFLIEKQQERYVLLPLTRNYIKDKIELNEQIEQTLRDRWIAWYLEFTKQYQNQHARMDYKGTTLEQEWDNLKEVLEWCIHHHRYRDVQKLWPIMKQHSKLSNSGTDTEDFPLE